MSERRLDKSALIKQSNRLVEARYKLTLMEQKLILAVISQCPKNATDFEDIKLRVLDLAKFCHCDSTKVYSTIKNVCVKLAGRTLQYYDDNGDWCVTHWLQKAKYQPREGVIIFRLDSDLASELLKLKAAYFTTEVEPLMKFNGKYSIRFYMLLKKMLKVGNFEYRLDELRDKFQLSKAYRLFANLRKDIIEPALVEINEKSDLRVIHEYVKEGRMYTKIRFTVESLSSKYIRSVDNALNCNTHFPNRRIREKKNGIKFDNNQSSTNDQRKISNKTRDKINMFIGRFSSNSTP